MALDGTYNHPKLRRLARALRVKPWAALGLMEAIWHWARKAARTGRIERDQWEDLADYLQWDEPAESLRGALVEQGLIDPMEGWDWIHDWHRHADDTVRKSLERNGEIFANGSPVRLPKRSMSGQTEHSSPPDVATVSRQNAQTGRQNEKCLALPARAWPEPEPVPVPVAAVAARARNARPPAAQQPPRTPLSLADDPEPRIRQMVQQAIRTWPNPGSQPRAITAAVFVFTGGDPDAEVSGWCERCLKRAGLWAQYHRTKQTGTGNKYIPTLERFFLDGEFSRDPPEIVEQGLTRAKSKIEQTFDKLMAEAEEEDRKNAGKPS